MKQDNPNNLVSRTFSCCAAAAWLALAGLLSTASGCKSTDPNKKNDDPLFGVKPPQVNPVPPANAPATNGQPRASLPPIPKNTSAGSTASLASLPGGRPLGIATSPTPNASSPSGKPLVQPIPREGQTPPVLLTTGAWTSETSASAPPATPTPSPAPTIGTSIDAAYNPLLSRGGVNPKAEPDAAGVRVTVLVPHRDSPGTMRLLVATARDVPAAVQALVQQIDQQR